jgi:hypothetical protein
MQTLSVELYPNPSDQEVVVDFVMEAPDEGRVRLLDLQGRILRDEQMREKRGRWTIETRSLAPGLYFLQAISKDRVLLVKKLIVQH